MGHYASEMDPNWGAHIERSNRTLKVKQAIKDKPLSEFKAEDIPHLVALFGYNEFMDSEGGARKLEKYA
jgi:hypothetical protein